MDGGYLVQATPPTVLFRFFCYFTDVFIMPRRYACDLDITLGLIFDTFFAIELSHFFGHFDNESEWTVGIFRFFCHFTAVLTML